MKKQKAKAAKSGHSGQGGRVFQNDAGAVSGEKTHGHDLLNTDYDDTSSNVNSPAEARMMDDRLEDQPAHTPYSEAERREGTLEKRDANEEMYQDLSKDRHRDHRRNK